MLNLPEPKRRRGLGWAAAGAALAIAAPLSVWAQIPVVGAGVDFASLNQVITHTVQELLELDAQRALDEEKRKAQSENGEGGHVITSGRSPAAQATKPDPDAAPGVAPPRLLAITGVGGQLTVLVDQAGRRAHYRAGHAEPVAGADLGLRLQAVSQPCASFVDQSQDVVTYCLNRGTP
ncbi:hypothetical protein U2261_25645 [Achromobacter xylosoxidans]|jgi:hypothetical protein|uniref:Type IV pilus biogenesis protein PilP n=1 Tax=Achromobacter ruhlandii TaxID=72557 RepID=A0A848NE48_9BURK|nr:MULTISPECIES: hypothetical protein [Achromobacter]MDZ5618022.1 hypothetical protein [Achromobacter xylosoxidans]MDZ5625889.1 hypothetical protein [Achromobacter xylosoxidans]MDZ5685479.1 hypothetical protein [Achromobacter xylosoxidans]NMU89796.1 hypothetical protein [Achromobacter ruhlandii]